MKSKKITRQKKTYDSSTYNHPTEYLFKSNIKERFDNQRTRFGIKLSNLALTCSIVRLKAAPANSSIAEFNLHKIIPPFNIDG